MDADAGGPVGNVRVSVEDVKFHGDEPAGWVDPKVKDTATSAGDGTFTLATSLPSSWRSVRLGLTSPGYDTIYREVWPINAAVRQTYDVYPTLVIRPGESIDVRVAGIEWCGWGGEAGACRRVVVASSPGDLVELELVPNDSSKPLGLVADNYLGAYAPVPRLMVPPNGVAYVIAPPEPYITSYGTARLTARR